MKMMKGEEKKEMAMAGKKGAKMEPKAAKAKGGRDADKAKGKGKKC